MCYISIHQVSPQLRAGEQTDLNKVTQVTEITSRSKQLYRQKDRCGKNVFK